MQIIFNDETLTLSPDRVNNIASLIESHIHVEGSFAIALNQQFIPKQAYASTILQEQDHIDVIIPMQGG